MTTSTVAPLAASGSKPLEEVLTCGTDSKVKKLVAVSAPFPPRAILPEELAKLKDPQTGLPVKDRWYMFKKYRNCFVASDLVAWFMRTKNISQEEAVKLCHTMFDAGVIVHIVHQRNFEDGTQLYRFSDDALQEAVASGLPSAVSMKNCNMIALNLHVPRLLGFTSAIAYVVIEQGTLYLYENDLAPAPYLTAQIDQLTLTNDQPSIGSKLFSLKLTGDAGETVAFGADTYEQLSTFISALSNAGMKTPSGNLQQVIAKDAYAFTPAFHNGELHPLEQYRGKVLYVVNVASF
jgi:hypothetical protein